MKVYRLETSDGKGAFWSNFGLIRGTLALFGQDDFPSYSSDRQLQESCLKIGCDPSIDGDGVDIPKPHSDWRYGFPSLRRLHINFPPVVLQSLEDKVGIKLKAYEVPAEYVARSKYQVIFNIKHAKEVPVKPR